MTIKSVTLPLWIARLCLAGATPIWGSPASSAAQFYVVARYTCVDTGSGAHKGMCEFRTDSKLSCQAAIQAQKESLADKGDVCRSCRPTDTAIRWDGYPAQFIQDGACKGMP